MFKLELLEPPTPKPVLPELRIPRLPLALRLRAPEGVCSKVDISRLAGALAGGGALGAGLEGLLNKHICFIPRS